MFTITAYLENLKCSKEKDKVGKIYGVWKIAQVEPRYLCRRVV